MFSIFKRLRREAKSKLSKDEEAQLRERAAKHASVGELHNAIPLLKELLKHRPDDVDLRASLANCLFDIGDLNGAAQAYDLAQSLDDQNIYVLLNRARFYAENFQIREALNSLSRVSVQGLQGPDIFGSYSMVYQAILFSLGLPTAALKLRQRAWLSNFDKFRAANMALFGASYAEISAKELAAEHAFWAATLLTPSTHTDKPQQNPTENNPERSTSPSNTRSKIRVGYYSPDFRGHSVSFFFRPLLENHDTGRFEIYLYHDNHRIDEQTEFIKKTGANYFNVAEMTTAALGTMWKTHDLDVLVELCGHTSTNRVSVFAQKHAKIQITALGYPPTTGLTAIDYKVIDPHLSSALDPYLYTETPLVLRESFWCFDPMDEIPLPERKLPIEGRPFVFGCIGNISKVSASVLRCWTEISQKTKNSVFLIQALNFQDPYIIEHFGKRLEDAGIPLERVRFRGPTQVKELFALYNEIDLVLDTFPFCGGTTSCFPVYMGVPVLTLAGDSVVGRMGASIMMNMGGSEWIAKDEEDYISKAVAAPERGQALRAFGTGARERFKASALGNGAVYARDFEAALQDALSRLGEIRPPHRVKAIAPQELVRRAHSLMVSGNLTAAKRVLSYADQKYPDDGRMFGLNFELRRSEGENMEPSKLLRALQSFKGVERPFAALYCANVLAHSGLPQECSNVLGGFKESELGDEIDRIHYRMLTAWANSDEYPEAKKEAGETLPMACAILISGEFASVARLKAQIESLLSGEQRPVWTHIEIFTCPLSDRAQRITHLIEDERFEHIICCHAYIEFTAVEAFRALARALNDADAVGFSGARCWDDLYWRATAPTNKVSSYLSKISAGGDALLYHWAGIPVELSESFDVLDGSMFAIQSASFRGLPLDDRLVPHTTLLEEEWLRRARRERGCKLLVQPQLLPILHTAHFHTDADSHEAALYLCEKCLISALPLEMDTHTLSVQINHPTQAASVVAAICQ